VHFLYFLSLSAPFHFFINVLSLCSTFDCAYANVGLVADVSRAISDSVPVGLRVCVCVCVYVIVISECDNTKPLDVYRRQTWQMDST